MSHVWKSTPSWSTNNIKNNFPEHLFIPGSFLSESELKVKKQLNVAEELQNYLGSSNSYLDKLKEVKKILPVFKEVIEGIGKFHQIDDMEGTVKKWEDLKVFNKCEEIKQWTDKWKKEAEKIRKESWQKGEEYTAHVEVFQPPKLFQPFGEHYNTES